MAKFDYKKICSGLTKNLPQRTTDVIERRFGLRGNDPETLDAIGQSYGRTRERIRQIEESAVSKIKENLLSRKDVFNYFEKTLNLLGGAREEREFLEILGGAKQKNHVFFLLANNRNFKRFSENDNFYSFWFIEEKFSRRVRKLASLVASQLKKEKRSFFLPELLKKSGEKNKSVLLSSIGVSKNIKKNPEGKFGLKNWIEISPRGVKDRAYLVLRKEEKPLHFKKIAGLIDNLPFPSAGKSHIATVHNELIKDERFVLVGRGLYALKEWGYVPGAVKDIIYKTLKDSKRPLTKEQVLDKVLSQRFVKANTVFLNLQNGDCFAKDNKGKYRVA